MNAAQTREEDGLLAAAQAGDERALEELLARYQGTILRFGLKMCGHPEDARDVLQETMLTAARSIQQFRGDAALATWLYQIARRLCMRKRKQVLPEESTGALSESHDELAGTTPEEQVASRQLAEALHAAIQQLDPKYREVFLLRDVEGLSAAETATVLGLQEATVKTRLHRARLQLRNSLAALLGPVPETDKRRCPQIARVFSRYLEGELSPTVCREMEEHVHGCSSCRRECETLRSLLAACRQLPTPDVPQELDHALREAIRALGKRRVGEA